MRRRLPLIVLLLAAAIGIAANTHDFFLLPENFFLHKGDKLNLHLVEGDQFIKQNEVAYMHSKVTGFTLYDGKKKIELSSMAKDSAVPIVNYTMENSGQALIEMNRGVEYSNYSRDSYADFLTQLGYDKLADKVKNGNQFRVKEKYTRYLKTLLSVDNHDGNAFEKALGEDFEITLKDNPYEKKYGDDFVAGLKFMGKPVSGATVSLYIKSISGNVYTQNYITDKKGEVTVTMSREGIYLLRSVKVEPTKDKDADFESWWASYTFPFSSTDDMPNTYKEFGFGNVH
jgi:uncharacterized GH25 family protein